MKLVAARDLFNSKPYGVTVDTKDELFVHKGLIHKGARFSIGTTDNYTELDTAQKFQVGTLIKYGLAHLDNKENAEKGVIAKIDAEARADSEARKKAMAKQPTAEELIGAAVAKAVAEVMAAMQKK